MDHVLDDRFFGGNRKDQQTHLFPLSPVDHSLFYGHYGRGNFMGNGSSFSHPNDAIYCHFIFVWVDLDKEQKASIDR